MVSKACDSQESSGASAALIPPWAAFECERTGWTLEMIPTDTPASAAARAARWPARPAPMTRTSCWGMRGAGVYGPRPRTCLPRPLRRCGAWGLSLGRRGVRANDHRVRDRDDLVDGQVREARVLADRLGAGRLVDAHGSDGAGALVEDVAANPADVVGHLLVRGLAGAAGGLFEVASGAPTAPAEDCVEVHRIPFDGGRDNLTAQATGRGLLGVLRAAAAAQLFDHPLAVLEVELADDL